MMKSMYRKYGRIALVEPIIKSISKRKQESGPISSLLSKHEKGHGLWKFAYIKHHPPILNNFENQNLINYARFIGILR